MREYENYRDSNVMWLGSIPAHWEVRKIKYTFRERSERGHPNEELLVSSQNMGVVPKSVYGNRTVIPMKDLHLLKLVEIGDFVISLRSFQGGIEYAYYRGIISPAYTIMVNNGSIQSSYFKYLAKSQDFIDLLKICVTGIREGQNIDYRKLRNHYIPVPPKDEQDQIARFLDWKITAIDKLISIRREELRNLADLRKALITREVTRGNWERVKIKRLFKIFSGATPDSYNPDYWDGNIIWITPADFQTKDKYIYHGAKYITESGFRSCSTSLVPSGSIIFTKRAPVGKVAISRAELCTNQGCLSCVPLEGVVPEYFYYVMSICTQDFESLSAGATFKEISLSTFRNFPLPCPPITEQKRIANYLDRICTRIDSAITNFTQQIDTLKELKARLISDTVTGKIDVRNITIPK